MRRLLALGASLLVTTAALVAFATPAQATVHHPDSGCVNIANINIGVLANLQGDPVSDLMHVSTTCNVWTWDVTLGGHACVGTVTIYLTFPHPQGNESYSGYHGVLVCGTTHILMGNLPVSTYFQLSLQQFAPNQPNPDICFQLGCEATAEW